MNVISPGSAPVTVNLADRRYDILVGPGLLGSSDSYRGLPFASRAAIVTNSTVGPLYAPALRHALLAHCSAVQVIELPDGEEHKDWTTLNRIFDGLLEAGSDRKTMVFALGGGVVGDMAGFAAACYMRGVPYVQVPTTLLAQVDSSVGGKTAINHPLGKNMIGVFNQPLRVIADIDTLDSLPDRELVAGLAEVIKYGPIADDEFLAWLESHLEALLGRDRAALTYAVRRSCEIKAEVVALDERESNIRAILNFGHTFGHAIETGLGYGRWLHGEAVGCGMVMATDLSHRLGLIGQAYATRVRKIIERAGLPVSAPALGVDRYLELMRLDKKAEAGEIRFVLIEAPGKACVRPAPVALVRAAIEANCA